MSTVSDSKELWSIAGDIEHNKYEKCRNITEEIYKRINITFEIKKLGTAGHSDVSDLSDQIDSNELSNETDLFACDKSDSICSSTEADKPVTSGKYININNNEETGAKKPAVIYKRPRKRFRKRVKKRTSKARSDSEGSSDEALPLSRIVEDSKCALVGQCEPESPDRVMGVPRIVILTKDLKPKIHDTEKLSPKTLLQSRPSKKDLKTVFLKSEESKVNRPVEKTNRPAKDQEAVDQRRPVSDKESKSCSMCSLTFRGERGLKCHIKMAHLTEDERNN